MIVWPGWLLLADVEERGALDELHLCCQVCPDLTWEKNAALGNADPVGGAYYCFVCGEVAAECAGCFLAGHDHFDLELQRGLLADWGGFLLFAPNGAVFQADEEYAEGLRPEWYLEVLERFEWDETQVPFELLAVVAGGHLA